MSKLNILFVDDEPKILRSLKAAFKYDFNVVLAQSVEQAQQAIANASPVINVVVTDEKMPEQKGSDLVVWLSQNHPEIASIILTGQADIAELEALLQSTPAHLIISKPWNTEQLINSIKDANDQASAPKKQVQAPHSSNIVVLNTDLIVKAQINELCVSLNIKSEVHYMRNMGALLNKFKNINDITTIIINQDDHSDILMKEVNTLKKANPSINLILITSPSFARYIYNKDTNNQFNEVLARPISLSRISPVIQKHCL